MGEKHEWSCRCDLCGTGMEVDERQELCDECVSSLTNPSPPPDLGAMMVRVRDYLIQITTSRKGSIGSIDNTYLPQLGRKETDDLFAAVEAALRKGDGNVP